MVTDTLISEKDIVTNAVRTDGIVMHGYTYVANCTMHSVVHYDANTILFCQQEIEYSAGIPCQTYMYAGIGEDRVEALTNRLGRPKVVFYTDVRHWDNVRQQRHFWSSL
jgi:hypothetical protein